MLRDPSRLPTASAAMLLLIALACAGDSGPPQWIEDPHGPFPEARYVVGVGQGPHREDAAEAARAEIARQTRGEREGIVIERRWTAKTPRVHWALAVLDRPALVDRLAERIAESDERLAAEATAAAATDLAPSEALDGLLAAFALLRERDALRERIAILDGTPPPPETTPSREALAERLAAVKQSLAIAVDAQEIEPSTGTPVAALDSVRRALAQQVLAEGFALAPERTWGDTPAWLDVRASVAFEPLDLGARHDLTSIEWQASLEILDASAEGRTLALLSEQARAVHLNPTSTRRLAREQATESLARALARWLTGRYDPLRSGTVEASISPQP